MIDAAYIKQANKVKNECKKALLARSHNNFECPEKEFFAFLVSFKIKLSLKNMNFIKES